MSNIDTQNPAQPQTQSELLSSFADYYANDWRYHRNINNRRLHFVGAGLSMVTVLMSTCAAYWPGYLLAAAVAFTSAWVGHRMVEKNVAPQAAKPWYPVVGFYRQFWDALNQRVSL